MSNNRTKGELAKLTAMIPGGTAALSADKGAATRKLAKLLTAAVGEAMSSTYLPNILGAVNIDEAKGWLVTTLEKAPKQPTLDLPEQESPETAERPGDAFEQETALADLERGAEASTSPRKRGPVAVDNTAENRLMAQAIASRAGKPWFRITAEVEPRLFAAIQAVGTEKLGAFRKKLMEGDAEFSALSVTQQNGILIRSLNKLVADGKVTRDGLIFGPADSAKAA